MAWYPGLLSVHLCPLITPGTLGACTLGLCLAPCRTAEEFYLHLGASIGFWRGDIKVKTACTVQAPRMQEGAACCQGFACGLLAPTFTQCCGPGQHVLRSTFAAMLEEGGGPERTGPCTLSEVQIAATAQGGSHQLTAVPGTRPRFRATVLAPADHCVAQQPDQ